MSLLGAALLSLTLAEAGLEKDVAQVSWRHKEHLSRSTCLLLIKCTTKYPSQIIQGNPEPAGAWGLAPPQA